MSERVLLTGFEPFGDDNVDWGERAALERRRIAVGPAAVYAGVILP